MLPWLFVDVYVTAGPSPEAKYNISQEYEYPQVTGLNNFNRASILKPALSVFVSLTVRCQGHVVMQRHFSRRY